MSGARPRGLRRLLGQNGYVRAHSRRKPSMMTRCDSRSARVSGESSALCCTVKRAVVDPHDRGAGAATMGSRA